MEFSKSCNFLCFLICCKRGNLCLQDYKIDFFCWKRKKLTTETLETNYARDTYLWKVFIDPFKVVKRSASVTVKPVVRLRATLQYCHAMLVFWLAVCSEQVAIQISICCLSKRFFILEYCELTAMASNITSVSKREKVISLWSLGNRNKEICSRLHLSPAKWDGGSGKTSMERTHSRYSKCGGICGVLPGF